MLPAAAAPVTPIILSIKKSDDERLPATAAPVTLIMLSVEKSELLGTLNEERKQVTAHTNLTQHASINDCVRYFDNGKEKQERDDSSEQKALNDDKCKLKRSPQACKQKKSESAQKNVRSHDNFSTYFHKKDTCNCSTSRPS